MEDWATFVVVGGRIQMSHRPCRSRGLIAVMADALSANSSSICQFHLEMWIAGERILVYEIRHHTTLSGSTP